MTTIVTGKAEITTSAEDVKEECDGTVLSSLVEKCREAAEQEELESSSSLSEKRASQDQEKCDEVLPTTPTANPENSTEKKECKEECDKSLEETCKRVFLYLHQRLFNHQSKLSQTSVR